MMERKGEYEPRYHVRSVQSGKQKAKKLKFDEQIGK